ncbi:hypothetical protein [Hungatella hathewayi]|uniref:hypothetical protein n=1 Tax=Hungatella hathewayi TaxID=154046 RepID=UPI0035641CC9
MKKKYLLIGLAVTMAFMVTACSNDKNKQTTQVPTEAATIVVSEAATKELSDIDSELTIKTSTLGIYKTSDEAEDVNGSYTKATFTDEYGNDFVATISKDTMVPDKLEKGKTYIVTHSDIMTMSLPGIYPEVYSIEESDEEIELIESQNSSIDDGEYETESAEADAED